MHHDLHSITSFVVVGPYALRITFDDNTSKTIDFWPMLRGELYDPLRDRALFERVRLDMDRHAGLAEPRRLRSSDAA